MQRILEVIQSTEANLLSSIEARISAAEKPVVHKMVTVLIQSNMLTNVAG